MPVNSKRRGFTLGEILVAVALTMVLAAITLPTVANQLSKGEPTRAAHDLFAIRDGINSFVNDVGKYPGAVDQLIRPVSTDKTKTTYLLGSASSCVSSCLFYGISDSLHWRGPYLAKDTSYVRTTAFGWTIDNPIQGLQFAITSAEPTVGAQMWAVITIQNVDTLDWLAVDKLFDDGLAASGSIRWSSAGALPRTLKYLAVPVS